MLSDRRVYRKTHKYVTDKLKVLKPFNHAYMAICATDIRNWAEASSGNVLFLNHAINDGMKGLRLLCQSVRPVSMADVAWLQKIDNEAIKPLEARIGPVFRRQALEARTRSKTYTNLRRAIFKFWIFSELCKNDLACMYPKQMSILPQPLPEATHRAFLVNCVPYRDHGDTSLYGANSDREDLRNLINCDIWNDQFEVMTKSDHRGPADKCHIFVTEQLQNYGLKTIQLLARDIPIMQVKPFQLRIWRERLGDELADLVEKVTKEGNEILDDKGWLRDNWSRDMERRIPDTLEGHLMLMEED